MFHTRLIAETAGAHRTRHWSTSLRRFFCTAGMVMFLRRRSFAVVKVAAPVVILDRRKLRVGPVANEHAIQFGRQLTDHAYVFDGYFFLNRSKVTLQKRICHVELSIVGGVFSNLLLKID